MHEIHAPALCRARWHWSGPSVKCHMFSSPHPHPKLQALEAIEPADSPAIHQPPFTP